MNGRTIVKYFVDERGVQGKKSFSVTGMRGVRENVEGPNAFGFG